MQNPRTLNVVARGITEAGTFALLQHHACGTNHEASMSSTYVWKATFASTVIPMVMDGTEHQQSSRTFIGILEAQLHNAALNGQGLGRALSHTYPTKCHSNADQNYLPMFATRSRREVRFRKPRIPHNFAGPILICGPDRAHMSDVNRKPAFPRHTPNIHKRTYFFVFCWGVGRQSHTHTHTHNVRGQTNFPIWNQKCPLPGAIIILSRKVDDIPFPIPRCEHHAMFWVQ